MNYNVNVRNCLISFRDELKAVSGNFRQLFCLLIALFYVPFVAGEQVALKREVLVFKYLEDTDDTLTIEKILQPDAAFFKPIPTSVPNLGLSDNAVWFQLDVRNSVLKEVFLITYPLLDSVDVYYVNSGREVLHHLYSGDMIPYSQRAFSNQLFVFNVYDQEEIDFVYFRVKSTNHIIFPVENLAQSEMVSYLSGVDIFMGLFLGIIIALLLYNLFLYFTVQDRSYLYYILYLLFIMLSHASLNGFHSRLLFPDFPLAANKFLFISTALSGVFAISFAIRFLRVRFFAPNFYWPLRFFQGLYIVLAFLTFFFLSHGLTVIFDFCALFLAVYGLVFSVVIARKGYRPAYFFLAAWSIFLLGLSIFVFRNLDILPYTFVTSHMIQIGVVSEVLLLSLALADRIKYLQKEKERTQREALTVSMENEKIIREQNILLEQRVQERTSDLVQANEQLNVTLSQLKETQSQLVDQEKMASLGQLTAGIAHEINNPINFVINNIKPLKLDIKDILELLDKCDYLLKDTPEMLERFKEEKESIDFEFLRKEMEDLLSGIEEGARRTSQIVMGLRSFSRLDEEGAKYADLREGIQSTLVLLNNKTKSVINIVENYAEENTIECYPGKLNQVFMNILTNAIDATEARLEKGESEYKPSMEISTEHNLEQYIIRIKDNGTGMPESVKRKIFEPFFTTKDVGKGTGLGMSIVFKIIQAHRGTIDIDSAENEGTEFIITLPSRMEEEKFNIPKHE
jgi:two-component system, NtrC family, sensor kinase